MEKFVPVVRENGKFYCFVQVKDVLFPNVPKSTLRSWMNDVDASCVPCSQAEREFLKAKLPKLSGSFRIIHASMVEKLLALKERKANANRIRYATKTASGMDVFFDSLTLFFAFLFRSFNFDSKKS